jgi:serine/threonine protein phosphatase 1
MKTVTYAIGDIHGRLDLLERLLALVETDAARRGANAKIVFTGDYMDRGADSFGVVERLMAGPRRPGDRFVCLKGNHDDLFVKAVTLGHGLPDWAWLLYWHTIDSYGVSRETLHENDRELRRHATFLAGLPLTHDDGRYLFVHAGIRPGVSLESQAEEDLLWIRQDFLDHPRPLPRRVVHGHTIMGDAPVTTLNRVSIDTGAYKSGRLTAAVIDGGEDVSFIQAIGEPDRGAIVREAILRATIAGRAVTSDEKAAHADYLAGRIEEAEMIIRSSEAVAA